MQDLISNPAFFEINRIKTKEKANKMNLIKNLLSYCKKSLERLLLIFYQIFCIMKNVPMPEKLSGI